MIKLNIHNETAALQVMVVGIAKNMGGVPSIEKCFDPKSKEHVLAGTYPKEKDCIKEMDALVKVLDKYNIKVCRPENIEGLNQIFTRDIAFVIEDKLVIPNIIKNREKETAGIDKILNEIAKEDIIKMPKGARAEGGDVIPWNEYIFVGYSEKEDFEKYTVARTNKAGLEFLEISFSNKIVKGFELNKSDENPKDNALHLDCCFSVMPNNHLLYSKQYISSLPQFVRKKYICKKVEDLLEKNVNADLATNNLIIGNNIITTNQPKFKGVRSYLKKIGFNVIELKYGTLWRHGGGVRCLTQWITQPAGQNIF